jgi:hypothetical protein
LESMDHEYLSSEFPRELSNYINHLINNNTEAARSGIEAKIKTTLQAIGENLGTSVLDIALKEHSNMSYGEFQKMMMDRVTKELSLQRDMGIRATDVAMCRTLAIVSRFDELDHRYAINMPIVSIIPHILFILI